MITNLKTQIKFPEVGRIRKGGPKQQKTRPDGSAYQTVGKDLGDKFRVVFAAGQEASVAKFVHAYGSLEPKEITIMLPFANVEAVWDCSYSAYNQGRLIARADGEKYDYLVNPTTGVIDVVNGEPFRPFRHGETINYSRGGRDFSLPMKPYGMLRVFIPDLERMVQLTLVTTSFYDCQNITSQLGAIQLLAGALNHGNVAGIPIIISRRATEITWVKEDGSASRITKYLINLEAHPEWVKAAIARLRTNSLPSGIPETGLLPAYGSSSAEITTTINPEEESAEDDEADIQGEYTEVPHTQPMASTTAPADAPAQPTPATTTKPAAAQQPARMTYETACTIKNTAGTYYKDIATDTLSHMLNTMIKTPQPHTEEIKLKIDAAKTIIAHRNQNAAKGK